MKKYDSKYIRNVAILGHTGSGKSNLKESILLNTGLAKRISRPNEEAKITSDMELFSVEWKDHKYNFIDTPGYSDFYGDVLSGVSASSGAVVVVDGTTDIQVGTDRALEITDKSGLPKIIFVNKIDSEHADYYKILSQLRERYGKKIAPFHVPIGKEDQFKGYVNVVELFAREYNPEEQKCYTVPVPDSIKEEIKGVRDMLMESVAETDEDLLEKYFSGEDFNRDEVMMGLRSAVIDGSVIPVLCGSTAKNIGIHTLMWLAKDYFPAPIESDNHNSEKDFSGQIFKTYADQFLGKVSLVNIISGKIEPNTEIFNLSKSSSEKVGKLFSYQNGELIEVEGVSTGDIVALTKLDSASTGDTLSSSREGTLFEAISFPGAQFFIAVEPKSKNDEDKINSGLQRLTEEDPSLIWQRNSETGQIILGAQGEIHADSVVSKLKNKFDINVNLRNIKIPYRESIKSRIDVEGRHKKQSGGHGQYGDVKIIFEPCEEHFVFEEKIVGGSVPKSYIPAVEKGILDSMGSGALVGYPVMNIKATLYDGSYHDVDSSEMAFKMAANAAFREALTKENSLLMEPVMSLEIVAPEEYSGDIIGDINKRRGRVLGIDLNKEGIQVILAEVPQAEIVKYSIDLRSMTHGRGYFDMKFARYEKVPSKVAGKIISGEIH